MKHLLLLLLLPACTVYRQPDGTTFAQLGGKVHMSTPTFELQADNEGSFRDATRLAGSLGLAYIAGEVVKAQDATQGATDKAGIEAATKGKEIDAGAARAALDQEVAIKALEVVP